MDAQPVITNTYSIKLAIVGGRDYNNYSQFKDFVDSYIKEIGIVSQIISGGAKGADSMAERYANENNIEMVLFKPDWNTYGRGAGILRNTDIITNSTHVLAFPSTKSVGTYDSIRKAKTLGKELRVINVSFHS